MILTASDEIISFDFLINKIFVSYLESNLLPEHQKSQRANADIVLSFYKRTRVSFGQVQSTAIIDAILLVY